MSDKTFHIRIKKQYAAELIKDLAKVRAVEIIYNDEPIELSEQQKAALDKEMANITTNPDYLFKWNDIKHRFKKH